MNDKKNKYNMLIMCIVIAMALMVTVFWLATAKTSEAEQAKLAEGLIMNEGLIQDNQGIVEVRRIDSQYSIVVDTETGVNYLVYKSRTGYGITEYLDPEGKVVISPVDEIVRVD